MTRFFRVTGYFFMSCLVQEWQHRYQRRLLCPRQLGACVRDHILARYTVDGAARRLAVVKRVLSLQTRNPVSLLHQVMACFTASLILLSGCANGPATIHRIGDETDGLNSFVVDYGASRRGAYVKTVHQGGQTVVNICAEPAPDVAVALTSDLTAELGSVPNLGNVKGGAKIVESIIDVARRGQALQIQREALYRLCELQANSGLSADRTMQLYMAVIKAIQAIAYTEFANSKLPPEVKTDILGNIVQGNSLNSLSQSTPSQPTPAQ